MALNLYQLKAFFTVAQTLNFSEAARKLYITQPAISHAVAKLGKSVKGELFKRTGNTLTLTETGAILYKACETAFYALERAGEQISAIQGRNIGAIRLGATIEFGTTQLIKSLKGFIKDNPDIHIDFLFSHDLLKPLLRDEVDIIIDCKSHQADGLEKTPLFREEYVVIAVREFVRTHKIRKPEHLSACPVLSIDKSAQWWGNFLNALPASGRPDFSRVTEMPHIRAIINAALEGLGIGFVPRYCVEKELNAKALVNVFPHLKLLEDNFSVYQKTGKAGLERHISLVDYLKKNMPRL